MMFNRTFLKKHKVSFAILLYISIYLIITTIKPNFLYNEDGTLRNFGLGYRNKTVIPMWLIVIILSILCYLGILYYLVYPKIAY